MRTADRLPPVELRRALNDVVAGVKVRDLQAVADRLSATYRQRGAGRRAGASGWSELDRLAYMAARMPATYRAASAVLTELRSRCLDLRVEGTVNLTSPGQDEASWSED